MMRDNFTSLSELEDKLHELLGDSHRHDYLYHNALLLYIFFFLYIIIFIIGLLGNLTVCFIILTVKSMRTVTNYFIFNLALADIFLCLFCMLFTPLYYFLSSWIFGKHMCHFVTFTMSASIYVSTFTLTAIALDRYVVIMYPFKPRLHASYCGLCICFIWVVSSVFTIPYANIQSHAEVNGHYYCIEQWSNPLLRKIHGASSFTLQYAIPLLIISISYARVSSRLKERVRSRPGSTSARTEEVEKERNKKTNQMLMAMVFIFCLSWLPLTIVNLYSDFFSEEREWEYYNLMFFVSHVIAMSSTCYNPFVYSWLNENFKREFKKIIPCLGSVPSMEEEIGITAQRRTTITRDHPIFSQNINEVEAVPLQEMKLQEQPADLKNDFQF